MTSARSTKVLAMVLAGLVMVGVVAACGDDPPPTLDYLTDARLSTANANTAAGNADGALMLTGRVLPGFSYLGASGQVTPDRDIGTVSVQAGPVQTLTYQFTPDAAFSDGTPLDCDDLVLAWTAMSGRYPEFGAATTAGYRDIEAVDCEAGAKAATVTFKRGRDYRDWLSLFGAGTLMPAQVVGRVAGVADALTSIRSADRAAIRKLARAWTSAFELRAGGGADNVPSSGPYEISEITEAGVLLVPNPKWWGDAPKVSRILVHGRSDSARLITGNSYSVADVTAGLTDGDAKRSDQNATGQVQAPDAPGRALGVEEVVLSRRGVFSDVGVRRAFASCVPRDALTRTFGQGAQLWNLRTLAPADRLAAAINGEFGQGYLRANTAKARELLAGAGQESGVRVRIGYLAPGDRQRQMVAAIADSCRAAGIAVTDVSSPQFDISDLGKTADAVLVVNGTSFSAAGAADPSRDAYQLFDGDPLDINDFDDQAVSEAIAARSVGALGSEHLGLVRTIEGAAWADVPSIPLFAAPRVRRWNDRVDNVVAGLGRNGTGWNMDRWVSGE
ncbi:ABC transporter substrate-binding protein [Gordonia sp. w5E2]|nr:MULTISPECIES: ABC transporter substrate-binding protein [Gordonia]